MGRRFLQPNAFTHNYYPNHSPKLISTKVVFTHFFKMDIDDMVFTRFFKMDIDDIGFHSFFQKVYRRNRFSLFSEKIEFVGICLIEKKMRYTVASTYENLIGSVDFNFGI